MNKRKIGIKNFFENYLNNILRTSQKINFQNLQRASELITKTIKKKKFIYVCGNGGSAAIADHYVCDFSNSYLNILN